MSWPAMDVLLSPLAERFADQIGDQRTADSRQQGWALRYPLLEGQPNPDHTGARAEVAAAVAYGLPITCVRASERLHDPDVANFDVRAVTRGHYGLTVDPAGPKAPPRRPHVLVVVMGGRWYRIAGWVFNLEAWNAEWWRPDWGRFIVPQSALRDPWTLRVDRGGDDTTDRNRLTERWISTVDQPEV